MNMIKKNGGFTLVELIVVIAILAILAAIAVPAYSGYISKANEASDYTQLDAIKTAAIFAMTEKANEATMTKLTVVEGSTKVDVEYKLPNDNTTHKLDDLEVGTYASAVTFKSTADYAVWLPDDPETTVTGDPVWQLKTGTPAESTPAESTP